MNDLGNQVCRCIVGACDDTCKYYDAKKACCVGYEEVIQQAEKVFSEYESYKDLEEQNKLLKLPCAVGDTVYEVQELRKRIQPYIVIAVHVSNCGNLYGWELEDGKGVYSNVNGFSEYAIGKQVFLTKEAAEAALKEMSE
ncbi:MAG: hypothetical protein K2H52_14045 [Lachnospiraceae bacterium]|nr:hypothetical protein [Lachnospiraceae bacterium]